MVSIRVLGFKVFEKAMIENAKIDKQQSLRQEQTADEQRGRKAQREYQGRKIGSERKADPGKHKGKICRPPGMPPMMPMDEEGE